jgi:outer membrane immunogenic protein
MKKLIATAALITATACSASAADLKARPLAPAYVAPVYNWTGFYIGGFVGGAFGGNSGFSTNFPGDVVGSRTDSAFFGGGQVGYNWQIAPSWVFGIEGDIGGVSNNNRTFTDTGLTPNRSVSVKNDWLASVTGRLGYTWGPGLIYVKGGGAFRDNGGISAFNFVPGDIVTSNRDDTGYTIGGGFEYMFAPAWSAKIEYQYYNFGNTNIAFGLAGDPTIVSYRSDIHTVKGGINYHFNWGR